MFMGSLINDDDLVCTRLDIHINWNAAYRCKVIDRQSGNRSRDLEVVMGSLIDDGD